MTPIVIDRIRAIIDTHARLGVTAESLEDSTSLYEAGMTSYASIGLMLALEDEFDIEFPDSMLRRGVFESVSSIREALTLIGSGVR
jgi:acyl carrier protein